MIKYNILKVAVLSGILALFLTASAGAQFKTQAEDQQNVGHTMLRPFSSSSFLGLFDPNRFLMRQNLSLGYVSGGGAGLSIVSYTNSLNYQIADPLNIRMDITLQGSPFGSYGSNLQSNLSKLFISNAELNYHLGNNTFIQFRYQQLPYNRWLMADPFGYYRDPFYFGER